MPFRRITLVLFSGLLLLSFSAPTSKAWASASKKSPLAKKRVIKMVYQMFFNKKNSGLSHREEIKQKDGSILVKSRTAFKFRYWFWKITGSNKSVFHYNKKGELVKFKIKSKLRGKEKEIWGTQNASGISIYIKKKGGTTKRKYFAKSSYDSTNLDLRLKMLKPGKKYQRRQLHIQRQELKKQTYTFAKSGAASWFGKSWQVWKVTFKSKKGKASLWMTSGGWMVDSKIKIKIGSMKLKLIKASAT